MKAESTLLSLRNVAKLYGRKVVLRDVSLEVLPGSVWLVVGSNGTGKSTLLRIMAGLARPTTGEILRGVGVGEQGFLGHATFNYGRMSARENLRFWLGMYGRRPDDERIDNMLDRVGLSAVAEESAGRFSRGMAQRLALARVFLLRPKLVFLDEPATGLDARSAKILRREIGEARKRGAALIWVSHQVGVDLAMADNVLHLEDRRVAFAGAGADFVPEGDIC